MLALGSSAGIGRLLASGFAERVNSQGNLTLDEGNTLLSDEEVDMLVMLRMNRDFLRFMRENFPKLGRKDLSAARISATDNAADDESSDDDDP